MGVEVPRREFLAGLGGLGAGLGLGGISHFFPLPSPGTGPDWSPGKEEFVTSTCVLCPSHCGIRGRVVDGNLVGISGNPLHPVSQGGLCPKGPAGIQLLYHPGRLTGPVERTGRPGSSEFRRVSWDEAIDRISTRLIELRDKDLTHTVGWLSGHVPGILGEVLRRFAKSYGTPHYLEENYADGSEQVLSLTQNIQAAPAFDLAASDLVLSFGAPLSEAWWCLPQAARARDAEAERRPHWIQIDIRHSRTAAKADEWIGVRPGTWGRLALGFAYVILKEGLYDTEAVARQVKGMEDGVDEAGRTMPGFRSFVLKHGRTEDVSQLTGVPTETIVRVAKAFGGSRRPVAVWDQVVSWRTGGFSDAMAIHALNVLAGSLGREGGVLVQPPLPVPALPDTAGPVKDPPAAPEPLSPGDWAQRVSESAASPLKVLFLHQANPMASAPDTERVARALERIALVVSFSPFLDESARHAHLVLPDHTYLERWQDAPSPASMPASVWGIVQPMMPPLHDTRGTGDVILDLASRLGGEVASALPWKGIEELVRARGEALASAHRGGLMSGPIRRGELRELESRGWWIPHGMSQEVFWTTMRSRGGWFDPYHDYRDRASISQFPDGRVRVFPATTFDSFTSAATSPAGVSGENDSAREHESLRLIPFRVMTLASGGTALMPWLLENLGVMTGDTWETWAEMNPETAAALGLSPDQIVRIESKKGSFKARLRLFHGAQPGTVNVPYGLHTAVEGWGSAAGANPLAAVGTVRDSQTGLPDWYSTRVRVVPG